MARRVRVAFMLVVFSVGAGCGGAGESAGGDRSAWCRAMTEIREAAAPVGPDDDQALIAVAPAEILDETKVLADLRARFGPAVYGTPQFEVPLDHVFRYEAVHCHGETAVEAPDPAAQSALLAAVQSPADDGDTEEAMQTVLDAAVAYFGIDGASVTVIGPNEERWAAHSGVMDATGTPVTAGTRFALASITKTYTTAVALRLADAGALSPDEAVNLEGVHPEVTLRQLLGHTSGLPMHARYPWRRGVESRWTSETFAAAANDAPSVCSPGECYSYSDLGFVAAGLVLERDTDQGFPELLEREVLEPLGLVDTEIPQMDDRRRVRLAALDSREIDRDPAFPDWPVPSNTWTAGGMIATSSDLARFGRALLTGMVLSGDRLDDMQDVTRSDDLPCGSGDCPRPYGLGLDGIETFGRPSWGHRGSSGAELRHFPEEGITIAALTTRRGTGGRLVGAIAQVLPELAIGVDA